MGLKPPTVAAAAVADAGIGALVCRRAELLGSPGLKELLHQLPDQSRDPVGDVVPKQPGEIRDQLQGVTRILLRPLLPCYLRHRAPPPVDLPNQRGVWCPSLRKSAIIGTLPPNANTASWLEDRLIAWDYSEHTSAYSPEADEWSSLSGPPVDACEDVPTSVTAEGFVFGELCGELVVMLPGENGWHNVTRRDLQFGPAGFAPVEDLVFVLGYEGFDQGGPTRMFAFRPPTSFACGGFSGVHGAELAGAVAARFELLRSDRPEALARPEIDDLLSPAGEAAFEDPASGLGGLFAEVALDRIMSIETLSGSDGFRVIVRLYDLGGDQKLSDELTLRAGTNLSGDVCALLVDDASRIGG